MKKQPQRSEKTSHGYTVAETDLKSISLNSLPLYYIGSLIKFLLCLQGTNKFSGSYTDLISLYRVQ